VSRRRIVAVVVLLLVVIVTGVALALPAIARRVVVWQLASQTGRAATLESLELRLVPGRLALRNLRVLDHDGGVLAAVESLEVRFRFRDLVRLHLHVVDGVVKAPAVRLVRLPTGVFSVADLMKPRPASTGKSRFSVSVDRFAVRDGLLTVEDHTVSPARVSRLDGLRVDVRDASTIASRPAGTVTLDAKLDTAPIALTMTGLRLDPAHFNAKLTARDVDLGLAALALPPGAPFDPPRGRISATATIEHDGVEGSRVAVQVDVAGIEVRRSGDDRALLAMPAVRLTVDDLRARGGVLELKRLAVDGGRAVIEDARLGTAKRWQVDGLAFEARDLSSARAATPGTASAHASIAGADLSVWAGDIRLAPVQAHATVIVRNVDLALARIYLPPDLPVVPERGVINATFLVDHGEHGSRLSLDAGLTRIELRRPGHFVTAPDVRVKVENVTVGQGALSIARVAVTGDRATLEERAVQPPRAWEVRNLAFEARDLSSRRDAVQGVATLNAVVAGATVSLFVTGARLDPLEVHATAVFRDMDIGLARLYLPPTVPLESARGVGNATFQIDHTVAGGTRVHGEVAAVGLDARAKLDVNAISLTAPNVRVTISEARRQGDALSVGRVEIAGKGTLSDSRGAASRIEVADAQLVTEQLTWPVRSPARVQMHARFGDRGELDASGRAQLIAPLPTIAWQADLNLKLRGVDLAPLGAYIPLAEGFGGRARASITANVTYADKLTARVQGDIGGGRFVLSDEGRTLLSLRRIDIVGLDAQWPDRIAIKRLHLHEPYGLVERDRQGILPLLARMARGETATPPPAALTAPSQAQGLPPLTVEEVVVENARAVISDAQPRTPVRLEFPRIDFTARDVTWPATRPARILLIAALPGSGTLQVEGAVTGEPGVDVTLKLEAADVTPYQPYLDFRARVAARIDAALTIAGPLHPVPKVAVRGDLALRGVALKNITRPVLSVDRIGLTGIDALWPQRVAVDRVRVQGSMAHVERDRNGVFLLRYLLETSPDESATRGGPAAAPAPPSRPLPELSVRELAFEDQGVSIVDEITTPAASFLVRGAKMTVRDLSWPMKRPVAVELSSPMPVAGKMTATATLNVEPLRMDVRAAFDGVAIDPAQPYLPIKGRIAGRVTGDVRVGIGLDPVTVRVTGDARLQGFRVFDGDRALVSVGRLEGTGIDVDWPKRLAVSKVLLRRPRLFVERQADGSIRLLEVVTPRWENVPSTPSSPNGAPPAIEIGQFTLEKADARYVDYLTTPAYVEELSGVQVVIDGLTTTPGKRMRFTGSGELGGGTFKLGGEGSQGERASLDLKLDLRDVIVRRANPYIAHFTSWTATRGRLNATAGYVLSGTHLDARHDVVVRDLTVQPSDERDEVKRRIGLPFGLLVSLLKDSHNEIKVSLPVSGDVATREFDFHEAVWTAVKSLALRLLASPFSRLGSLFVSEDSKVEAVSITPVAFEAGTAGFGTGMDAHLDQVAKFLRGAPAIALSLEPIFTQADVDALKRGQAVPVDAAEALRALGTRRLEAVRAALTRGGGVDVARLGGRVPRAPFVESAGTGRVELDVKPEPTP
jgi:uncharacterized protein involved in outer membrane biogenesis